MEAKNPTAAAALSAHSAGAAGTSGMETSPTGNPPLPVVKPIHAAAMYGEVDTLAAILERDPMALEARDSRGYTPLMCAVENVDALEMVRQLVLNHAADVNAALPETGQTVLHIACQRSNAYAVQLLADAGADLAQQDICGRNVFHWGAIGLTGKVLRRLIDQTTSDVWDAADRTGYTPLLTACEYGRVECVKVLKAAGSKLDAVTRLSHTAIELADWYGHADTFNLVNTQSQRVVVDSAFQQPHATTGVPVAGAAHPVSPAPTAAAGQ
ncbi:ESPN [Symbiodinium sp. KB8]|nr:ESPN [Symbiodinium sp. KB8]